MVVKEEAMGVGWEVGREVGVVEVVAKEEERVVAEGLYSRKTISTATNWTIST